MKWTVEGTAWIKTRFLEWKSFRLFAAIQAMTSWGVQESHSSTSLRLSWLNLGRPSRRFTALLHPTGCMSSYTHAETVLSMWLGRASEIKHLWKRLQTNSPFWISAVRWNDISKLLKQRERRGKEGQRGWLRDVATTRAAPEWIQMAAGCSGNLCGERKAVTFELAVLGVCCQAEGFPFHIRNISNKSLL